MVGSVDAPEPGFRPGALGALARAGGSARQNMVGGEPARFSPRRAGGLGSPEHGRQRTRPVFAPARAGDSGALGFWHALGVLVRWGSGACCGLWRA